MLAIVHVFFIYQFQFVIKKFLYAALTFAMNDLNCKKTKKFANVSEKKGAIF